MEGAKLRILPLFARESLDVDVTHTTCCHRTRTFAIVCERLRVAFLMGVRRSCPGTRPFSFSTFLCERVCLLHGGNKNVLMVISHDRLQPPRPCMWPLCH